MDKFLCGRKALEHWGFAEVCETLDLPVDTEYVIFSDRACYRPPGTHQCRLTAAKRYTEDGICTPPYLFLRYAHELSILKLIYLGLQLCSCPAGRIPQCTVRKIKRCAVSLNGHKGRRKALQAVQFIQNNSYSPMESKLYMHLYLPNYLGGCGFPKASFNHPVRVDSSQYYLDLYFPEARLGVEYDSFEYHSNARSFSQDSLRDAKLLTAGYRLIHVKPSQLSRLDAFEDLVINISRLVNKYVYISTPKFFEPFKELFYFFEKPGYTPVRLSDVPRFAGVTKAFEEYRKSYLT